MRWVYFFQDTNAPCFKVLPACLAVSKKLAMEVSSPFLTRTQTLTLTLTLTRTLTLILTLTLTLTAGARGALPADRVDRVGGGDVRAADGGAGRRSGGGWKEGELALRP